MDLEHERRLAEAEARSKSNSHRLDDLEDWRKDQTALTTSVALMAEKQNRIEEDVVTIKNDVKGIAEKPGKRWDSLVDKILTTAVAILVGYLMAKLGVVG